ncbi:ABZJ_00895 family protein [uncultured Litoreibacter sp.]|uniref:ABZJ_00895 family protein n=1 Tax=uncultured Litoreibacter sp. TaxID=1392394 RepID=UPI00260FEBF1|nr:ABZJ_00895 family protein [uncultured Litoreibacter sp.]
MNSAHLIKLYTVYFLLTVIGLGAGAAALSALFDVEIGGSLGIVTVILPSMLVGHRYAKRWESRPPNGYAWRLTAIFTLINIGLGLCGALVFVGVMFGWQEISAIMSEFASGYLLAIAAVMFLIYWLAGRFFFGFGAKNQLKSVAEKAARAAKDQNQP